ncbi:MAG TPA: glycosyltransferase family 2 protein [Solirubrobacteraceae bacterium]|nr:glycosyltransferase family 2 protein [Solirubrobacteraceae bacterium]
MSARPTISVVMPFAGDLAAARAALHTLAALRVQPGDQRILADNAGIAAGVTPPPGVQVVDAAGERSPAHARNTGARQARGDWILFLDADCIAPPDLLDRFFLDPPGDDVGALAGEVVPAAGVGGAMSVAERYGAARSFLSQRAHLAHRYLPRAAAANLLVRRAALEQLGGFYEGLRAAEDTDFSWRLQQSGWRLELRAAAHVEHRYRATVGELRRQWRGYAAGRAWLGRRYPGFAPEPALARGLRRAARRGAHGSVAAPARPPAVFTAPPRSRSERASFLALDAILAGEELAGLLLSNRPAAPAGAPAEVVLVADRFPELGDPLVEFATSLDRARVEAAARPERIAPEADGLPIDYREDDGLAARVLAAGRLVARHPVRSARDRLQRGGGPTLAALAPAVARLRHDPGARVHGLGGDGSRAVAARLAALSGARHELHTIS